MKKYNEYINENITVGKLIFDGDIQYESDVEWNITIDISESWNNYEKNKIDKSAFIGELIKSFNSKSKEIDSNCWNDLASQLNKLKTDFKGSNVIYNSIYDICDKNLIHLKT